MVLVLGLGLPADVTAAAHYLGGGEDGVEDVAGHDRNSAFRCLRTRRDVDPKGREPKATAPDRTTEVAPRRVGQAFASCARWLVWAARLSWGTGRPGRGGAAQHRTDGNRYHSQPAETQGRGDVC